MISSRLLPCKSEFAEIAALSLVTSVIEVEGGTRECICAGGEGVMKIIRGHSSRLCTIALSRKFKGSPDGNDFRLQVDVDDVPESIHSYHHETGDMVPHLPRGMVSLMFSASKLSATWISQVQHKAHTKYH